MGKKLFGLLIILIIIGGGLFLVRNEGGHFWTSKPKHRLTLRIKDYIYKKPIDNVKIEVYKASGRKQHPLRVRSGPHKDGIVNFNLPEGEYICKAVGGYMGEIEVDLTSDTKRELLVTVHVE